MSVIKEFQTKYGLISDGIIGKNTLSKIKEVFSIQSSEMLANFMGQCHVESAGFNSVMENLNYSSKGLLTTFKKYFTPGTADLYQHNPEKIANKVYANRMGNGDEASGDGWKHRGFGVIQLTGKDNQDLFANKVNDRLVKINPSLIATIYPFESAKFFFDNKHLWSLCTAVDEKSITALSYRVNGGTNGLQERIKWTNYYYNLLK